MIVPEKHAMVLVHVMMVSTTTLASVKKDMMAKTAKIVSFFKLNSFWSEIFPVFMLVFICSFFCRLDDIARC